MTLTLQDTERAIKTTKDSFEKALAAQLHLRRVTAPRFLVSGTGLLDDLAGTMKPVAFKTGVRDEVIEIVHSLAKWKRQALGRYGFEQGTGLYTDMDAIRAGEEVDETHSIYVDQWDWEKVMSTEERTLSYLKETVQKIYAALKETERIVGEEYGLSKRLPEEITFVHSEDLEKKYPEMTSVEREDASAKEHGAIFLIGIGGALASGHPHDVRASDYDDWSTETTKGKHGLNGDIIVWDDLRGKALELSSMGIRVDAEALCKQVKMMGEEEKLKLAFHKGVLSGEIPLSIGGGIGQSRLCMYLLHKKHIGEVQCSVWPVGYAEKLVKEGIVLL